MNTNMLLPTQELLGEDAKKYFESHPEMVEQLRKASAAYRILGEYLNLTQTRIIVRESGASTSSGVELGASLLRTDL